MVTTVATTNQVPPPVTAAQSTQEPNDSLLTVASPVLKTEARNQISKVANAPPGPGRLNSMAIWIAKALGSSGLKVAGGAMMVVGFGTSWLGFGFFLGVAGAGLWVISTSTSCLLDTQKPAHEQKGQVNILVKSAGWATPVGWVMLIPHWILSCLDKGSDHRNPAPQSYVPLPTTAGSTRVNSPSIAASSPGSQTLRNTGVWLSQTGSPATLALPDPPRYTSPPPKAGVQPQLPGSPRQNPDSTDQLAASLSRLDYTDETLTDVGPPEVSMSSEEQEEVQTKEANHDN